VETVGEILFHLLALIVYAAPLPIITAVALAVLLSHAIVIGWIAYGLWSLAKRAVT
jgi:hypothetical protein